MAEATQVTEKMRPEKRSRQERQEGIMTLMHWISVEGKTDNQCIDEYRELTGLGYQQAYVDVKFAWKQLQKAGTKHEERAAAFRAILIDRLNAAFTKAFEEGNFDAVYAALDRLEKLFNLNKSPLAPNISIGQQIPPNIYNQVVLAVEGRSKEQLRLQGEAIERAKITLAAAPQPLASPSQ